MLFLIVTRLPPLISSDLNPGHSEMKLIQILHSPWILDTSGRLFSMLL